MGGDDQARPLRGKRSPCAFEDVSFGPFDIYLHDIRRRDTPARHEIVEGMHFDFEITFIGESALSSRIPESELLSPRFRPGRGFVERHVSNVVQLQVLAKLTRIGREGLEGDHPA